MKQIINPIDGKLLSDNFNKVLTFGLTNSEIAVLSKSIPKDTLILTCDNEFEKILVTKYFSFYLLTPSFYDTVANQHRESVQNISEACLYLKTIFDIWKDDRSSGFLKLYEALTAKYNPIHNYDKTIKSTTDYKGTEQDELTRSGSEKDTFVKGSETTTTSKTATDSSTYYPNSKTEDQTYTDTNTKKFGSDNDPRKDTNVKSYTNRQDEYNYHEYGNIGVTTTQQMITSQFPLTEIDELKRYIVNLFVHENLIL